METLEISWAKSRVDNLIKNMKGRNVNLRSIKKAAKMIASETKTSFIKVMEMVGKAK